MNKLYILTAIGVWGLLLVGPDFAIAKAWTVQPGSSIQCAIDSAFAGDTVLVQPGTYAGNLDFLGKDIVVQGMMAQVTIIDCSATGGSCIAFKHGESQSAVLANFTITGGTGSEYEDMVAGGGIFIHNAEPTIQDNIILANTADWSPEDPNSETGRGGGIICIGDEGTEWKPQILRNEFLDNASGTHGGAIGILRFSSPTIKENVFHRNEARGRLGNTPGDGGGVWIYGSGDGAIIQDNAFDLCNAKGKGGGIYAAGIGQSSFLSLEISRNIFRRCRSENFTREHSIAPVYGGLGGSAIWCGYIDARIENNTFVENDCPGSHSNKHQGTLAFEGPGHYEVRNNLIALTDRGGGIACERGPTLQTENNLFWQNGAGNHPQCPDATDETNLLTDPYFCDTNNLIDPVVAENSPALTSPTGPIGARTTPACEPVSYEQATWGRLKQIYR